MNPADLPRQEHGRVAGRVEAERDLLERERRLRDREAELGREHQVEAAGARGAVHRADERHAEIEAGEERGPDAPHALEGLGVEALAAREALRSGDRRPSCPCRRRTRARRRRSGPRSGSPDRRRSRRHAAASSRSIARIERVRLLGPVERHERDVRMVGGALEANRHARPPVRTPKVEKGSDPFFPLRYARQGEGGE